MKTMPRLRTRLQRWLAVPLTWMLILGQVALPVYGQSAPPLLADSPIAAKVSAKPNIVYTLDDSGSMQLNYIPEYVVDTAPTTAIASIKTGGTTTATVQVGSTAALNAGDWVTIAGAVPAGYNGYWQIVAIVDATHFTFTLPATLANTTTPGNYTVASAYCRSGNYTAGCAVTLQNGTTFTSPPFFAADFNRMAYNPSVTYYPPIDATGNPFTTPATDAKGNFATTLALWNAASVQRDPYAAMFTAATKDNLGSKVNVPLYCNTDWPITSGGAASNLVAADVFSTAASSYGQKAAGTGDWCRINGTEYDLSAASGAPHVDADYNYPYQSSSGATGPQYFYKQLGNKILYCDKSSPYWPRNGTIVGCTAGGTPTCGGLPCPTNPQTCNKNAKTCDPVVASRVYNPGKCSTDPPGVICKAGIGGSDGFSPGTATDPPECYACTCTATFQPAGGRCSSSGAACTGPYGVAGGDPAECPGVPQAPNGCSAGSPIYSGAAGSAACSAFLWDPAAGVYSNQPGSTIAPTTLVQDSNGDGLACRHNNQTYAVTGVPAAGGLFTYPRTNIGDVAAANKTGIAPYTQTGAFTTATTSSCPTVGTTIPIYRHYYTVDSVEFCDNKNLTADDQWRGFGTGVCKAQNDLTTYKNVKYGRFHRWDLFSANLVPFPSGKAFLAGATPGPQNSEAVNYANWYAYYATRLNAAKTTSATAFSFLNATGTDPVAYRVGFHTLGDEPIPYGTATPITFVDVEDWDNVAPSLHRNAWYSALFGVKVSTFKTPTLSAMLRIGNLFERGGSAGVDTTKVNALPGTAKDPVSLSCQSNFHILFTDGVTNQNADPGIAGGNQDANIPGSLTALAVTGTTPDQVLPNLAAGGAWPAPFKEGTPSVADTLADIATYYWTRDLRDGTFGAALKNDVPSWSGKGTGDIDLNPVKDVAWWQHVNFSAISFGTEGVLDATDQLGTLTAIKAGTKSWPDLTQPNHPTHPFGPAAGAVAVDDLWHATLMGRGSFVSAKSPIEVSYGLSSILAGIQNQRTARVGAAIAGQVLGASNIIYQGTIEPGWAGDLLKIEIDQNGAEVKTWWQAGPLLSAAMTPAAAGDEPWMDEAKRRIVTINSASGAAVGFRYANLSAAQLASLSPDTLQQKKMIAYLRGGSTYGPAPNPAVIEGTGIGQFRKRFGILGDISDAQPAVVGPPLRPYVDVTDPGYSVYAATYKNRPTQIVAPANDGMVHVFDAGPDRPVDVGGGSELFAFIPKALFRGVAGNQATEDPTAIQALTYQDGGVPIYHHHMYVDASPKIADVDFGNGTGDWHTIAIGGLGKGGNSYYALDLTDNSAADETAAAGKVMWEWSDPDIRFSYSRPVIVKVRDSAFPTGRWVAIVSAGYNNVSGKGKLFFLDAKTGALLGTVNTGAGSAANPSGLVYVHAFVKDQSNQIAEQIYGGDLLGNVWRIDVSTTDSYKAATADLFAKLTDSSGNAQPVTTAPQIEVDVNNGVDRYVFIGTGRLLHADDFVNPDPPQQQTMYAIRDGTVDAILAAGLPILPRATMSPISADGVSAIAGGAPNGWYHDLPAAAPTAERIVVDVQADINIALYIGTQAPNDPCAVTLPASIYARDYTTGRSLISNGAGGAQASAYSAGGGVGGSLLGTLDAAGNPTLRYGNSQSDVKFKTYDLLNPVTGPGNRLSWRLLQGQ